MGRGSPIPPMLRPKIVEQYQKGVSQRKIAKSLKFSSSTVHNIIQRFRESGTISVRKGQGRKTILDARDLRALRRHCITYRNATVMEITTWAQEYFQKTLSVNTIHRAIRRRRLKLYRSKKKPYLNMIQKRRCFLWAKAHLKWTVAKWKTVLWSDQSKFEVPFGKLGRHVIRTKEDKDNPSCYQRSVQKPASLMVWGCMSVCGMGSLHIWKGTINAERVYPALMPNDARDDAWAQAPRDPRIDRIRGCTMGRRRAGGGSVLLWKMFCWETLGPAVHVDVTVTRSTYLSIVADHVHSFMETLFPDGCGLFQQDNAPCHKAEMVQEWFDDHNNQFEMLTPPPNSPDLNPIQHLWDVLDKQVRSMKVPPRNLQDLKDLLLTSWCQIPQHTFRDLVESMPRRFVSLFLDESP
ncbi:hypothetical protein QTP70_007720 [Hemibagrus guttatus]|uniref:Tc1-like transposase DDE domain-containing protein n=1 Tax=Hemibagrus guttatus TaxID=175788 RepID=A0AAE0QPN6_9TELE|nr:hypothetical protein QTP70_007720 [Hemibagrus guttatus]